MGKKLFIFVLLVAIVACFAACTTSKKPSKPNSSQETVSDDSGNDGDSGSDSTDPESGDPEHKDGYVIVTFNQEGQDPVYKYVETGGTLVDIPEPVAVIGYTIEWDVNNFENIDYDLTVNAIITRTTYYIYYDIGDGPTASISAEKTAVYYGDEYTLLTPTRGGYDFGGWVIKGTTEVAENSGVYDLLEDTYLVAVWNAKGGDWINPFI